MNITAAARKSPLSQAQFVEIRQALHGFFPHIVLKPHFATTAGDQDLKTSLKTMGQTDFFTKEIDGLVLSGKCEVAIHSAKDLPAELPPGLEVIALTAGIDPADVLVLAAGATLASLPPQARIATSSFRREAAVAALRDDLQFIDVRGTIEQRLHKIACGEADGVVIAEAALIRLGLTHLTRIRLPGDTCPMQGRLAVVARSGDKHLKEVFTCLDSR